MRIVFVQLAASCVVACGAPSEPPQAGPATGSAPIEEPKGTTTVNRDAAAVLVDLDLGRAKQVVGELEAGWGVAPDEPLLHPKSLDDVLAILKRDQVTLFPKAIEFVREQDSLDALALHGQIELAWGETYLLLFEITSSLRHDMENAAAALESRASRTPQQEERLAWLRDSAILLALRGNSLKMVAVEHIASGSAAAEKLIEGHADSYLGYRLMADYFRTLRDWEQFAAMVAKVEETNPNSNGLLFLRGAAAFQQKRDRGRATELYTQALTNDPEFVRAQAHLLIIQSDIADTHRELEKLERLNEHHQFVLIAGDAIRETFEDWKAQQSGGS